MNDGLGEVPDDDAGCDGDIHGVLGAKLGNLQAAIRGIDDLLMDTLYLIAKNDGVLLVSIGLEVLKHRGTMSLFDGIDLITVGLQFL